MSDPILSAFQPRDREGFALLVNTVHAEFGFEYDPVLDADLDAPEEHYSYIVLVRSGHSVLGSAALTAPAAGVVTLKRMYLQPSLRGQGWGRGLLEAVTAHAVREGRDGILLDTTVRQTAARRLYESAGFELYRRDQDTLYYAKSLRRGAD